MLLSISYANQNAEQIKLIKKENTELKFYLHFFFRFVWNHNHRSYLQKF